MATALEAVIARFDEVRESFPDFTHTDALMVGVGFLAALIDTTAIDVAPSIGPERHTLYQIALDTTTRRLRRDRDEPQPERDRG